MKKTTLLLIAFLFTVGLVAQKSGHPRFLTGENGLQETKALIDKEDWAKEVFAKLKHRTDEYVEKGPEWLVSRLQMYWNTHATEVYVKGEFFDHAGGAKAPAPTVMYSGARNHATNYIRPRLKDLPPYQEDSRGLYLAHKTFPGNPYEWVSISKTGTIIQSINVEIIGIARDAAFLWWITGDKKYAELAASVFDTYMTGIYYRNVPVDLNNGHQQTLVGMSSFEVIHEDALDALVPLYDFLYDYLVDNKSAQMPIYAGAFKKWADNIIDNGVPHNNWNLIQANYLMNIGIILEDNATYTDSKGSQHYLGYVLDKSSIRQWSLSKLADYGFDASTGIWSECAGYSSNVIKDYTYFMDLFGTNLNVDLIKSIPIIPTAVMATPQYLFPNKMIVGFGDTHPGKLNPFMFEKMIKNAQIFDKPAQEETFTKMLKLFNPAAGVETTSKPNVKVAVTSFFAEKPLKINSTIPAGSIDEYVTPTFYVPKVSWLVQRNGMDQDHSLMISQNASEGNHMHANGISMELYGKGYVLGPDAGIGLSLYSGLDYLEYYSQFPAHNTVCVDGISSYPVMKSNHAFKLLNCYPSPGIKTNYPSVTFSEVYFKEPESQADQNRIMGIVSVEGEKGYYVDIFRSKKSEGGDKMHDYFYHNLGQEMGITQSTGDSILFEPTQELAFAGAHLYAYSYLFDKKCAKTAKDIKTDFTIRTKDGNDITMTMWMKGENERTIFSALSPMTEGLSRIKEMPYEIKSQPTLTFVARQEGEAWNRPFVSVFEPSTTKENPTIERVSFPEIKSNQAGSHVGVEVKHRSGRIDRIISSDNNMALCSLEDMQVKATYALCGKSDKMNQSVFMGNGFMLKVANIQIQSKEAADVLLEQKNGIWYYTSSTSCVVSVGNKRYRIAKTEHLSRLDIH